MINYLIIFTVLTVLLWLYIKWIGKRYKDVPNQRSSHKTPTPTSGGFIILLGIISWGVIFQDFSFHLLFCTFILAFVGMIDDFKGVTAWLRLLIQFVVIGIITWQTFHDSVSIWLFIIIVIGFIGWLNSFNFMDGINGIAGLYALITLGTLAYINVEIMNFVPEDLIIISGIGVLAFGIFNFRNRALVFAGDVGSITLAFITGYLMLSLVLTSQNVHYLLLFIVFGIDAGFTIFQRLLNRENIFTAHRKHLYQYLANEKGINHITISVSYAALQLIINIGLICILRLNNINLLNAYILGILLLLSIGYFITKKRILMSESSKLHLNE